MVGSFTRNTIIAFGAALAAQAADVATASTGPAARASTIAKHSKRCAGKESWSDPAPPIRIFGNVYDVGTCNITVLLIAGEKGVVVIDGATAEAAPSIVANIERLGFKPSDVKLLLSSHEHADHAAGLNEIRRRTGATMVAMSAARTSLETGIPASSDPQRSGNAPEFRGVRVDRIVRDGEVLKLGALRLTAHATPGHSPGGTSWSWRSCADGICHQLAYVDSVSAVSTGPYRFSDHPAYVAVLRATLDRITTLPCDFIITPHPAASSLYERLAGLVPLHSMAACASYAAAGRANLDRRMLQEAVSRPKP